MLRINFPFLISHFSFISQFSIENWTNGNLLKIVNCKLKTETPGGVV